MIMTIMMVGYTVLKLKYMINQEEWALIQQTVLADEAELLHPILLDLSLH